MNAMAVISSAMAGPPAAAPGARGNDDGAGSHFARCLDEARDNDSAGAAGDAAPRRNAAARSGREAETRASTQPAARAASDTGTGVDVDPDATEPQEAAAAAAPHDDAAAAPAPDLAALLPGWTPPAVAVAGAVASAPATACADAPPAEFSATSIATTPPAVRTNTPLATPAAATPANDTPAPGAAGELKDTPAINETATTTTTATPNAAAFATLPSAPRAAEPALPTATMTAPVNTPAFAPALATQLRWWAHDGVQQAQLLLNPAEMGPVAVKIVLDGREARIDFSADHAATRSALEAALPVLAAALDDGGLKLCGGGVHDGSAQQHSEWHGRGVKQRTLGAASARNADAPGAASATVAGRGLVDLVA